MYVVYKNEKVLYTCLLFYLLMNQIQYYSFFNKCLLTFYVLGNHIKYSFTTCFLLHAWYYNTWLYHKKINAFPAFAQLFVT